MQSHQAQIIAADPHVQIDFDPLRNRVTLHSPDNKAGNVVIGDCPHDLLVEGPTTAIIETARANVMTTETASATIGIVMGNAEALDLSSIRAGQVKGTKYHDPNALCDPNADVAISQSIKEPQSMSTTRQSATDQVQLIAEECKQSSVMLKEMAQSIQSSAKQIKGRIASRDFPGVYSLVSKMAEQSGHDFAPKRKGDATPPKGEWLPDTPQQQQTQDANANNANNAATNRKGIFGAISGFIGWLRSLIAPNSHANTAQAAPPQQPAQQAQTSAADDLLMNGEGERPRQARAAAQSREQEQQGETIADSPDDNMASNSRAVIQPNNAAASAIQQQVEAMNEAAQRLQDALDAFFKLAEDAMDDPAAYAEQLANHLTTIEQSAGEVIEQSLNTVGIIQNAIESKAFRTIAADVDQSVDVLNDIAEAETEAEGEAETEAQVEAETEAEGEAETEAQVEAETEAEGEAETEAEGEAETEAEELTGWEIQPYSLPGFDDEQWELVANHCGCSPDQAQEVAAAIVNGRPIVDDTIPDEAVDTVGALVRGEISYEEIAAGLDSGVKV